MDYTRLYNESSSTHVRRIRKRRYIGTSEVENWVRANSALSTKVNIEVTSIRCLGVSCSLSLFNFRIVLIPFLSFLSPETIAAYLVLLSLNNFVQLYTTVGRAA